MATPAAFRSFPFGCAGLCLWTGLVALLWLTAITGALAQTTPSAENEPDEHLDQQEFTLTSNHARAQMSPFIWNLNLMMRISMTMETRSHSGTLLSVRCVSESAGTVPITLHARVLHHDVWLTMLDESQRPIAMLKSELVDIANGKKHRLSISIAVGSFLVLQTDSDEQSVKIGMSNYTALTVETALGAAKERSNGHGVIGCFSAVLVMFPTRSFYLAASSLSTDVIKSCVDLCTSSPCQHVPKDKCLNFYSHLRCDCFGSDYEGETCNEKMKTIDFTGGQYISFNAEQSAQDRKAHRVAVRFRTTNRAKQQIVSLLLGSSKQSSDNIVLRVLMLEDGSTSIWLHAAQIQSMSLPYGFADNKWHSVIITFKYYKRTIFVTVDRDIREVLTFSQDGDAHLFLRTVYFGNQPSDGSGLGFFGCMKDMHVGHKNVLRLTASAEFSSKLPLVYGCKMVEEQTSDVDDQVVMALTPTCKETFCQHRTTCVDGPAAYCDCGNSKYTGRLCQFSSLYQSCQELLDMGETTSGVYIIDPDGFGSANASYVRCEMDARNGVGTTVIEHNVPDAMPVRGRTGFFDTTYEVAYGFFTPESLRHLIRRSAKCVQYIRYDCNHAPLGFPNQTWFKSAIHERNFGQIGEMPGLCSCNTSGTCTDDFQTCNCDSDVSRPTYDAGYMHGVFAGITEITVLQSSGDVDANLTLGPLRCTGSHGMSDVIQFKSRGAVLEETAWLGRSMSFWFRTSLLDAMIISQQSSDDRYLEITIAQGALVVKLDLKRDVLQSAARTFRIDAPKSISDNKWHRVTLEHVSNEIMVTLDGIQKIYVLTAGERLNILTFDERLTIGGTQTDPNNAYVGCLRQFYLDGRLVKMQRLAASAKNPGITAGCQNHCASNPCEHGGTCIENYETDDFRCDCSHSMIYFGSRCEIDINDDSVLCFQSPAQNYLHYMELQTNLVTDHIVFSFRTDQSSALLLYAHDQFYNFIQVSLMNDNRLSLTINSGTDIRQCTIHGSISDFNNMHWVQGAVEQNSDHTVLRANNFSCSIVGVRTLSTEYVSIFHDPDNLQSVFPPRLPVAPTDITSYSMLYVGGLPTPKMHRNVRRKRQSLYNTVLPGFAGCLRGLLVGHRRMLLEASGQRHGRISEGCDFGGQELNCQHGGYKAINWMQKHPMHCECMRTSYTGANCSEDVGFHFDGQTQILYRFGDIFGGNTFNALSSVALTLSFSTDSLTTYYQLLFQWSNSKLDFDIELYLIPDGLLLTMHDDFNTANHRFTGHFADGYRHLFYMRFYPSYIGANVDDTYSELPAVELQFYRDAYFIIGGGYARPPHSEGINYTGCISNLELTIFNRRRQTHSLFKLMEEDSKYPFFEIVPENADLKPTTCAAFAVPLPSTETPKPEIELPYLHLPLVTRRFTTPTRPPSSSTPTPPPVTTPKPATPRHASHPASTVVVTLAKDQKEKHKSDGNSELIIAILLSLLVLVVLIFGLVCYCRRRTAHRDTYDTQENYKKGQDHFDEITPETPLVDPADPEQGSPGKGGKDKSDGKSGMDKGKAPGETPGSGAYDYESEDLKYVDENAKRLSHEYPPPTPLRKSKGSTKQKPTPLDIPKA